MVVADGDAVLRAESLEGLFGLHRGLLVEFCHKMDISEIGEVVHKNGGTGVAGGSRGAAMCGDKAGGRTNQLIDADDLPRESGGLDRAEVANAFSAPRFPVGFAVSASGAKWWWDVGKFVWKDVGTGEEL